MAPGPVKTSKNAVQEGRPTCQSGFQAPCQARHITVLRGGSSAKLWGFYQSQG